jgi:hypothetical protein
MNNPMPTAAVCAISTYIGCIPILVTIGNTAGIATTSSQITTVASTPASAGDDPRQLPSLVIVIAAQATAMARCVRGR